MINNEDYENKEFEIKEKLYEINLYKEINKKKYVKKNKNGELLMAFQIKMTEKRKFLRKMKRYSVLLDNMIDQIKINQSNFFLL